MYAQINQWITQISVPKLYHKLNLYLYQRRDNLYKVKSTDLMSTRPKFLDCVAEIT